MACVIGILSGKGGVGKTTLAINFGAGFAYFDENVSVVDGDLKNPNLGLYLGLFGIKYSIQEPARRYEKAGYEYNGLKVFPASLSLNDGNVNKIKYIIDGLRGYAFIDFPPGLTIDTINLMEMCDKYIVVTNPTVVSLASTMRFLELLKQTNKEIIGIVVNKTGERYEIGMDEIEVVFPENVIGSIPHDDNVSASAILHKTVLEYNPFSPASLAVMNICGKILGKEYKKPGFAGMRCFLRRLRNS